MKNKRTNNKQLKIWKMKCTSILFGSIESDWMLNDCQSVVCERCMDVRSWNPAPANASKCYPRTLSKLSRIVRTPFQTQPHSNGCPICMRWPNATPYAVRHRTNIRPICINQCRTNFDKMHVRISRAVRVRVSLKLAECILLNYKINGR